MSTADGAEKRTPGGVPAAAGEVTRLLAQAGAGRREVWDRLLSVIYPELKDLAGAAMRHERPGHTLSPTALVHEAFLRLVGQDASAWNNRRHFFGAAAVVMRRILVDHARRRRAEKRGGGRTTEPLDAAVAAFEERSGDLVDLDDALSRLDDIDATAARIVELRFFAGLANAEVASQLGISESTVERTWRTARAWLLREVRRE